MSTLTNPTTSAVNVPEFGLSIEAGETIEVSDTVAAAFAGHPVLHVTADAAVPESAPVVEPEPAPVVEHVPTAIERAEAEVARASADLQAAQAATTDAAPAANTEAGINA